MHWSSGRHRRERDHHSREWPPEGWAARGGWGSKGGFPAGSGNGDRRLRKIPERGYVGGVCAGIAERVGVEAYLVRMGFVGMGFVAGPLALLAYFVLMVALPRGIPAQQREADAWARERAGSDPATPGPATRRDGDAWDDGGWKDGGWDREEDRPATEKRRASRSPAEVLAEVRAQNEDCERRVADMERHVTTQAFTLDKAFRDLDRRGRG